MMINYKKVFLLFSLLSLLFVSCKNWDTPTYLLTVHLTEGIVGVPEAGVYQHEELKVVEYEYKYLNKSDKEKKPAVFINDSSRRLPEKGAFAIYGPTDLYIGDVDPRGEWTMTYYDVNGDKHVEKIVYEGESISQGTFTAVRLGTGTWSVEDYKIILTFIQGSLSGVEFTADLSPRYINGKWKNQNNKSGEWNCRRDKATGF